MDNSLWGTAKKAWGAVGHVFDLQQLLALFGLWKLSGGLVGGILGLIFGFAFAAWGLALSIAVGVAVGLFIANELASRRIQSRLQRQSESPAAAGNDVEVLIRERDGLAKKVVKQQEQMTTQELRIRERELLIKQDRPAVEWATSLVEKERGPSTYLSYDARFWSLPLDEPEPYFEIAFFLTYVGALELIIAETQSGRLAWDGRPFSQEPILTMGGSEKRPFRIKGPTSGQLHLRQYVSLASASKLQAYIDRWAGLDEVDFWAKDLEVSVSKVSPFDGKVVSKGRLLGEELTVKGTKRYKPPTAEPSFK